MTWLTWRLHRTEAMIGILLFVALMMIMFLGARSVDSAYDTAWNLGCFNSSEDMACSERLKTYFERSARWNTLTTVVHGVPLAAAALLLIPTLQELERGTHRLAWTQSISRRRWSLSRIGFAAGVATILAAVWAIAASNWRASVLRLDGPSFYQNAFELSPAVLFGYGLYVVALGLGLAVIVRRLVPTLALLAVGFIGTRIFTTFVLRQRYRSPIEETTSAASYLNQGAAYEDRWVLDESWMSPTGERLGWERVDQLCMPVGSDENHDAFYRQCLVDNDLQYFRSFHPNDRVSQFQLIEMALYLGLAVALFALTYWWLTRRPA